MPSSYTPRLRLTLPADGELSGSWGQVVNQGITSLIEAAIAGASTIAMPDADYTLTVSSGADDQARSAALVLTGALTAARAVICPSLSKQYIVKNTTGQTVTVKTASGTGVAVKAGATAFVWCDGANVSYAFNAVGQLSLGGNTLSDVAAPVLGTDAVNKTYADALVFTAALPSQAGNAGNDITTDGTTARWSRGPRRYRALAVLTFLGY